jgi:hypothetical protein
MNIFIIDIGIIGPKSCFDYINFRTSLVIKNNQFEWNKKNGPSSFLVIFYVNVITCQNFNLSHIYCIFAEKIHFLK